MARPHGPTSSAETEFQEFLAQDLLDTLRFVAPFFAALYAAYALGHLLIPQETELVPVVVLAGITSALFFAEWLLLRRRLPSDRYGMPIACAMLGLSLVNVALHLVVSTRLTNLALVLVAGGLLLPSARSLAILAAVALATWSALVVLPGRVPVGEEVHYVILLGTTLVLAALVQQVRLRSARRLLSMQRARDQAHRAEEKQTQALHVASHELRGPLNPLSLSIESARRATQRGEPVPAVVLERMERQARALARMITDMLEAARLERGALSLQLERFDLALLCREQVEACRQATGRVIELQGADAPLLLVADPVRARQVLVNLLENAAKYSPASAPIVVSLALAGEEARLAVADGGPGVPLSERERIFERFARLERDERTGPGLGLGLYVCRQIAELHGGSIRIDEGPLGGAQFTLGLPVEARAELGPPPARPQPSRGPRA